MSILVINSGSSSVKYGLYDNHGDAELFRDVLDLVKGERVKSREEVIRQILSMSLKEEPLTAIGHRIVHGGQDFRSPVLIDEVVVARIRSLHHFAPLHNPACSMGIAITLEVFPHIPQVAVFDTAFASTLPESAWRYALPKALADHEGIRRYGFHGISHQYVASQAEKYLNLDLDNLRMITLHLGNGASAAAIKGGRCVETSMGLTPQEGLVMGTRAGDLDPSILIHLQRHCGYSADDLERLLNRESGLKGVCGDSDMRLIRQRAEGGDRDARLAIALFVHRIRKYIGAYSAILGGLDCLVFTGGIGERDADLRREVCGDMAWLGIHIDQQRNAISATRISMNGSTPHVLVVPTNEELAIARRTQQCLSL